MAPQREPGRECLVVDRDSDVWARGADAQLPWACLTNSGELTWADLEEMFGPLEIYIPKTDDGAAVAAQSMGGSLPLAAPSSPIGPGPAVIGGQPGPDSPVRAANRATPYVFELYRHVDKSGVSGVGVVAEGCMFTDGSVAVRWRGDHPATAVWPSVDDVLAVHGHQGATEIRWVSTDVPIDLWPAEGDHRAD